MQIQIYLRDNFGISRRKATELIKSSQVFVNNVLAIPGQQLKTSDVVICEGRKVIPKQRALIYVALNKPAGFITTKTDPFGRRTVFDLLPQEFSYLFPVGRLDYDTEGLLLLTNDGQLTNRLTHPKFEVEKVYLVHLDGKLSEKDYKLIKEGLDTSTIKTAPARIKILDSSTNFTGLEIAIHEGQNREIRRIFEVFGFNVIYLQRISVGKLKLVDLGIRVGEWKQVRTVIRFFP